MVGRDDELSRLTETWRDVSAGRRTVVIGGEPGVGKSRLLACSGRSSRASLTAGSHCAARRCGSTPPSTRSPRWSARAPGIRLTDEPEQQRRLIRAVLPEGQAGAELSIGALLGLETEGLPGPEQFRRDLMEALHCWLAELATPDPGGGGRRGPALERPLDARADAPASGQAAEAPVLLVVTRRLEGDPGLTARRGARARPARP